MNDTTYKNIVNSFTKQEAIWFLKQSKKVQIVYFNFKKQISEEVS